MELFNEERKEIKQWPKVHQKRKRAEAVAAVSGNDCTHAGKKYISNDIKGNSIYHCKQCNKFVIG
jgi:hypothetical protein